MGRYEIALIAGIATAFIGFFVFTEYLLGAEPPAGFKTRHVPIYCGPAAALRDQLLKSQSSPIFSGQAMGGAFMIFQPPPQNRSFIATYWSKGVGCIIAAGTDAQIHDNNQWTMREKDGSKKND